MRATSSFAVLIFVVVIAIGGAATFLAYSPAAPLRSGCIGGVAFLVALVSSLSIRVADQWDSREYEAALHQHYHREGYWVDEEVTVVPVF